jgi:integrase
MLLPIKAICSKSKIRKDGTSIIFLQYCGAENQRVLLNTEIAIPPAYWSRRHRCVTENLPEQYGIPIKINERVVEMQRKAEDIVSYGIKHNISDILGFVKATFHPNFDLSTLGTELEKSAIAKLPASTKSLTTVVKSNPHTIAANIQPKVKGVDVITAPSLITEINSKDKEIDEDPLNVFIQFDDYMKSKKNKVTAGMIKVYNNTKGLLKEFEIFRAKKITFDCIDFNFYDAFVEYLTNHHIHRRRKVEKKGLKKNSIGKTVKHLRVFINDRVRRKIIPPIDLSDFKSPSEDADAIYLTPSEIDRIYNTEFPPDSSLEYYRDLLVLGCLTGLRFSDFSSIQPEDVKGDMLYKKQQKSDGWVVIPLRPIAYHILVNKFKGKIPETTNPEFNRHIKTVGRYAGILEMVKFSYKKGNQDIVEKKPKSEWITSHTCRRSFCTNEFLAGTPVELIMKISGHKSLRDFYRYIRITPEEAGNKIKELWRKREEDALALKDMVNVLIA